MRKVLFLGCLCVVFAAPAAAADQTTFTLYSRSVDGSTDFAGTGFPAPGSTFVQASALYTTPDRNGIQVGTIYLSCNLLLTPFDGMCIAAIKFANGTDAINAQGYYTEAAELSNNCGRVVQVLGVSGGTGAYNGAQGQVSVTHIPVNPDPNNACAHSVHDFIFAVSLKHPPKSDIL
jgi:hypothetical protein